MRRRHLEERQFKLTFYGCMDYVCCVSFASLDVVRDELHIVRGMLVCSSFLISVCMFIVSKALLLSGAALIFAQRELFG